MDIMSKALKMPFKNQAKKIEQIRELGFYGMVLNSNIWKSKEPLASFNEFMGKCKELNIQVE